MSLRLRFQLLTLLLFVAASLPMAFAVREMAESIVSQWAVRYAEKQVLHDKSRLLQPILREVALSKTLSEAPALKAWALDPENPAKRKTAFEELEQFRNSFQDQSYFVALVENGGYYYNNGDNEREDDLFRYFLDPNLKKDSWFFDSIRLKKNLNINVNPDPELGLTKLWINVMIQNGAQVLGIAGTGLDLSEVIDNIVDTDAPGVTSLIINHAGSIQLHRDRQLIEFSSISKQGAERNTISLIFTEPKDLKAIFQAMDRLRSSPQLVTTEFVNIEGRRHIAGIAYIPEIDWYEITLLDLDIILPLSQFKTIMVTYALGLLGILLLFNYAIGKMVLTPLRMLNEAMDAVAAGHNPPSDLERSGVGEIKLLMGRFTDMAKAVSESRMDLEEKILKRTADLDRLTKIDPMTELLNRRGMSERMLSEMARTRRNGERLGLLWLDLDDFKEINDKHGHHLGDEAIQQVAHLIRSTLRPYDLASRWGGDEFLLMTSPSDPTSLATLATRLIRAIGESQLLKDHQGMTLSLSVSVGGCISTDSESLDSLLRRGDQALYAAKAAGDGRYRFASVD